MRDHDWLSVGHAVQYIMAYFSGREIVKAIVRELGKSTVLEIIEKEC